MHDHGIPGGDSRRLLAVSLGITASVFVVQIAGAWISGSLALLADAVHMLADAGALVIALFASIVAARPADDRSTYGYQRAEVLGAFLNGIVLILLCGWIAVEAVQRLLAPEEPRIIAGWMLAVAIVGLVANALAALLLHRAQLHSMNVRGAYLEVLGDLAGSAAVILAAVVILTTGWTRADAIASLLIAAFILPRAIGLLREVFSVLSESAPKGTEVARIREHLLGAPGVRDVHDVHVWQLTRGAPVFTAHVVVEQEVLERGGSAALLTTLQGCLADHFDVAHSTFQLEAVGHEDRDGAHH